MAIKNALHRRQPSFSSFSVGFCFLFAVAFYFVFLSLVWFENKVPSFAH
jgi:hypothetical protein